MPRYDDAKAKEETGRGRHTGGAQCDAGHHPGGGETHPAPATATEKTAVVLYRDVTIREKITPDGERRLIGAWQSFRGHSGQELSNENARRLALSYLSIPLEEPSYGYPCRESLKSVFWRWPEQDSLAQQSAADFEPTRPLSQTNVVNDVPSHRQSKWQWLRCLFQSIHVSYFKMKIEAHPAPPAAEETTEIGFVQWFLPSRQLLALAKLLKFFALFIEPVRFPVWVRRSFAFGIRRYAGLLNLWADFISQRQKFIGLFSQFFRRFFVGHNNNFK